MWNQLKHHEVWRNIFFHFSFLSCQAWVLSVHVLKLFCTANALASGASSTLKINKQRCSSYINYSSPVAEALRKASTPITLNKGRNVSSAAWMSTLLYQCSPGPSQALGTRHMQRVGPSYASRGLASCLETSNVGECDSTSLACAIDWLPPTVWQVLESPGMSFSKEIQLCLVFVTLMLSNQ